MDDYVSFEIAKKLKEKGFPQRTFGNYNMVGSTYYQDGRHYKYGCVCDKEDAYTAPTIAQVLKWLRDEKKIFVEIALSPEGYRHIIYTGLYCMDTPCAYHFSFDGFYNMEELNYRTYEQAAIEGIKYVLNNLI